MLGTLNSPSLPGAGGYPHSGPFLSQLVHNPRNKIRGIYNRAEYLPERRKMMQDWADFLSALRANKS